MYGWELNIASELEKRLDINFHDAMRATSIVISAICERTGLSREQMTDGVPT